MIENSITYLNAPLESIKALTAHLSDAEAEKIRITSRWNLKETIAHLMGWANQFKEEIEFLLNTENQSFPWFISAKNNWAAFNDKNVATYQDKSLLDLIKQYEQINTNIIDMLQANKDTGKLLVKHEIKYYGKFSPVTILQMIKMKRHHELEHLGQIEEKIEIIL